MKKGIKILLLFEILILFSCAQNSEFRTKKQFKLTKRSAYYKSNNLKKKKNNNNCLPIKSNNNQNPVNLHSATNSSQKYFYMVCSYYGKKFQGKTTSNGEIFDLNKLTCANKTLPFGTILKITDEDSGLSVNVRVNDRGPFVKGRDLDLSEAAAKKIGLIKYGVKNLK